MYSKGTKSPALQVIGKTDDRIRQEAEEKKPTTEGSEFFVDDNSDSLSSLKIESMMSRDSSARGIIFPQEVQHNIGYARPVSG
jgi:hypothetical protein